MVVADPLPSVRLTKEMTPGELPGFSLEPARKFTSPVNEPTPLTVPRTSVVFEVTAPPWVPFELPKCNSLPPSTVVELASTAPTTSSLPPVSTLISGNVRSAPWAMVVVAPEATLNVPFEDVTLLLTVKLPPAISRTPLPKTFPKKSPPTAMVRRLLTPRSMVPVPARECAV